MRGKGAGEEKKKKRKKGKKSNTTPKRAHTHTHIPPFLLKYSRLLYCIFILSIPVTPLTSAEKKTLLPSSCFISDAAVQSKPALSIHMLTSEGPGEIHQLNFGWKINV